MKNLGLLGELKRGEKSLFYSIVFIYHFTQGINPGILKWLRVAVSEFRRICNNPSKQSSPFQNVKRIRVVVAC
jgi:hypothetical protein